VHNTHGTAKTVAVCDTEPIAIEGLGTILGACRDLRFVGGEPSLIASVELVRRQAPAILVIDKGFGVGAVIDYLTRLA